MTISKMYGTAVKKKQKNSLNLSFYFTIFKAYTEPPVFRLPER